MPCSRGGTPRRTQCAAVADKRRYIVHPSFWLRTLCTFLNPFMSKKLWAKVVMVESIEEFYFFTLVREQVCSRRSSVRTDVLSVDVCRRPGQAGLIRSSFDGRPLVC